MSFARFAPRSLHAALLALALLSAQALGLAHRVAHALPHVDAGAAAQAAADDSTFGSHEPGGIECRLLDQAAQADALTTTAGPALLPRVPAPLPAFSGRAAAGAAGFGYRARGPPAGPRARPSAA